MDNRPKKPCRYCGKMGHFSYACFQNPKRTLKKLKRSPIKKIGKVTEQWLITRATWIRKNPPDAHGYYYCYLGIHPWCPGKLTIDKNLVTNQVGLMTLDHVIARTKDYSKRFTLSNLKPACSYCNEKKGSKNLDQIK